MSEVVKSFTVRVKRSMSLVFEPLVGVEIKKVSLIG